MVPGEPLRRGGGLNARGVAKYGDFGPIEGYIYLGGKLLLITNMKSSMSF